MSRQILQTILMTKTAGLWDRLGSVVAKGVRGAKDWRPSRGFTLGATGTLAAGLPAMYYAGKNQGEIAGQNKEFERLESELPDKAKGEEPGFMSRAADWMKARSPWEIGAMAAAPVGAYALWKLLRGNSDEDEEY